MGGIAFNLSGLQNLTSKMIVSTHILSVFAGLLGVFTAASSALEKRTARESAPSGCLTVRASGASSSEYSTINSAVTALGSSSDAACIFIYGGTYSEQVAINYAGNLTLYGYTTK